MALYDQNWDINSYNQAYGNNNLDTQFQGEGDIMRYMDQDYNYRPPGSFLPSGIGSFYNTPYPGSAYSPHRGFEEMQFDETVQAPEKTGSNFNFLNLLTAPFSKGIGLAKKGMEFIGERFQRPEAKQRFYDEVMQGRSIEPWQTGMYKGNEYGLYNSPSGLKVSSDIIGWGEGREKNLDSMFGSKSIEEMEEKKLDWFRDRVRRGKAISQKGYSLLDKHGYEGGNIGDQRPTRITTTAPGTATTTGGGGRHDYTRDRGGGYTLGGGFADQRSGPRGTTTSRGDVRGHHSRAEGGRVGLYAGGDPEETTEDIFEFMQDQNIPHGEMASDDNNTRILENLFEKYLQLGFSPEEAEIKAMEEFQLMSQGQDFDMGTQNEQGIASLV